MEAFAILVFLGITGAMLWVGVTMAENRQRSPWLGIALVALLGIVGLAILFFVPTADRPRGRGDADLRETRWMREERARRAEERESQ